MVMGHIELGQLRGMQRYAEVCRGMQRYESENSKVVCIHICICIYIYIYIYLSKVSKDEC